MTNLLLYNENLIKKILSIPHALQIRHFYKINIKSKCHIEFRTYQDLNVVSILELPDNPGTSITNASEVILNNIISEYNLTADNTIFLEIYHMQNTIDIIIPTILNNKVTHVTWKHLDYEKIF